MGAPHLFSCSALLLALAAAAPAFAQFAPPDPAELKMTTDPKAPGAASVYLYREDITDMSHQVWTEYERIKVLTEKGKEMATVRVPFVRGYDKIASLDARTIHADGTIVPFTDKPDDLLDVKTKNFQADTLVFNLPSVEVGSILEYRIKVVYSPSLRMWNLGYPTWWIQQPTFVHKAHYVFDYPITVRPGYRLFIGTKSTLVSETNHYSLDIEDVPPLPDDDWMPPLNTLKWRVHFFVSSFATPAEFWEASGKPWADSLRQYTEPTGTFKKAVAGIVAPGDSETVKAQKIYASVMKIENTDFERKKSNIERKREKIKDNNNLEDTWKRQRGNANEITVLFIAMARSAGLNVVPMQVVNRDLAIFDATIPSTRQLDDFIAVAQLDGKEVYLDPGEKFCPFGLLHWKHNLTGGFRLADKKATLSQTPAAGYKNTAARRVGDLVLDPEGGVTGTVRFVLTGQEALHWRQLTLQVDEDELKKRFNETMQRYLPDGVHAEFDHFLGLDEYEASLLGIVQVSGNIATSTGKRLFLPGLFLESHASHPFVAKDKRTMPIDVHYPVIEEDDVTYHLPPGFTVESCPQPANIAWTGHATLKVNSSATGDSVRVVRVLAYNYTILDPHDYDDLRGFYQKIATADQQQLVLTRATAVATKGN